MSRERFGDALEERAAELLPEAVHRYVRQGSAAGRSTAEATAAWDRLRFLPHVLRDVSAVDTSTTLLGTSVRAPVGIAPTTLQRAADEEGEVAMARGAAAAGSLMVLSSNAGSTFADVAATGAAWWLQAYVTADRRHSRPLLEAAVSAGARAVVLTVDTPVVATKHDGDGPTVWEVVDPSWVRANFAAGTGEEKATDLGPGDIGWLSRVTGLPVVVKGVLRADDARVAVDAGAAAVWVSNHGGRQLDGAAATADCLAAVAQAVGGHAEVYVDGGLRTGTHLLGALALGARAAFLGRPPVYALAVGGSAGVRQLLEELSAELAEALALAGCASPGRVGPDLLAPGP